MVMGLFASVSIETEDMAAYRKLEEMHIPVVFFDRVAEEDRFHKVCLADAVAAKMAAEAILKKDKKKVLALFGHPHLSITKVRCSSFKETMAKGSPATEVIIDYPENVEASRKVALEALQAKERPDAIFCMGDMILIGVMYAVHQLKLRVPEDIGIISISNGLFPTMYDPKITYVETSGYKLGKLAFSQMLGRLKNEPREEEVTLQSVLVEGGSL